MHQKRLHWFAVFCLPGVSGWIEITMAPMSTTTPSSIRVTVYGIPNCDTVKKSRQWLSEHAVEYAFHDFKKQGLDAATLDTWFDALGWEAVLNRKGTTWRKLDAAVQAGVTDAAAAAAVALEHLSIIKRPVLEIAGAAGGRHFTAGFAPQQWEELLLS